MLSEPPVARFEPCPITTALPCTHEDPVMDKKRKTFALAYWQQLLEHPELRMSASEQHDELLRLAEQYFTEGFITLEERRVMIEKAAANYRRAVEGVGQGT